MHTTTLVPLLLVALVALSATAAPAPASPVLASDDARRAIAVADTTDGSSSEALSNSEAHYRLEINGMIVDETRSRHGRDFYDLFYTLWSPPEDVYAHTIRIQERPGRGRGSVIVVRVNDEIVYQSQVQPRYSVVEQAAARAVQQTHQLMRRYDMSWRIF